MSLTKAATGVKAKSAEFEIIEFFIREKEGRGSDGAAGQTSYYGVNVAKVLEVIENSIVNPPPAPPHPSYLGTIPLRGQVLPVLDLSVWLQTERDKREHEVILVTEFNERLAGFLVSGVTTIHTLEWRDVQPPSKYIASSHGNCVNGVVDMKDHFTMILDFDTILSDLDPEYAAERDGGEIVRSKERHHALVAEDSTTMRVMTSRRMQEANFEVTVVNTGQEAWEELQNLAEMAEQEGRPVTDFVQVLVSDVEMPQMDGYTLTRNVKSHPVLKDLPVILFSSNITDDLLQKGKEAGADDQISKPEFKHLARRAIALIEH